MCTLANGTTDMTTVYTWTCVRPPGRQECLFSTAVVASLSMTKNQRSEPSMLLWNRYELCCNDFNLLLSSGK